MKYIITFIFLSTLFFSCTSPNENPQDEHFKGVNISGEITETKASDVTPDINQVDLFELSIANLQGNWECTDFKIISGNLDKNMEAQVKASTMGMSFVFNNDLCTLSVQGLQGVYKVVLNLNDTPQSIELHPHSGLLKYPAKYVIAEYSHNKMIFEETRQGTVYHTILGRK